MTMTSAALNQMTYLGILSFKLNQTDSTMTAIVDESRMLIRLKMIVLNRPQ